MGKKNKFESFENTRNNKFSVYKYEKNNLIGKSEESNIDDHDYIMN